MDPYDYNLLCLKWKNEYFCDLYTPFGHSGGSLSCSRLTSFFRYLAYQRGYTTYTYVDDVIGLGFPDNAQEGFTYLTQLLEELNFPISNSKLVAPTHEATCLGIIINVKNQTLSIPPEKLKEDINWFMEFTPKFNGTTTYCHLEPKHIHTLAIDASLHTLGGTWQN